MGLAALERGRAWAQVGTSLNYSENAVHVVDQIEGVNQRLQYFTTVGLFERTDFGLNVGLAYDFLYESYYDHFYLGQWRGQAGYAVNDCNELGAWFTVRDHGDSGTFLGTPVHLKPLNQLNFYWQHIWPLHAQTTLWMGLAEGHGEVVFVFPENVTRDTVFVYGAQIDVPLNDWISIFGAANFLTPADTGTVDAYLGFEFYPGGGAKEARQRRFSPFLPLANNPTFAVDPRR